MWKPRSYFLGSENQLIVSIFDWCRVTWVANMSLADRAADSSSRLFLFASETSRLTRSKRDAVSWWTREWKITTTIVLFDSHQSTKFLISSINDMFSPAACFPLKTIGVVGSFNTKHQDKISPTFYPNDTTFSQIEADKMVIPRICSQANQRRSCGTYR